MKKEFDRRGISISNPQMDVPQIIKISETGIKPINCSVA